MLPILIYCANGNARFAQIAINAGFRYGAQLPGTIYHPVYFADQNWKKPDRNRYMAALAEHKPAMATVLDLEREDQFDEVMSWAEEAAQYVEQVLIIPKAFDIIPSIPRRIGSADVVLAYSVPTKFGGTSVPVWEFAGWPVHLLGGSPLSQLEASGYMNVVSVDGNYSQKMAVKWCQFFTYTRTRHALNQRWPRLREVGWGEDDAPYEAFRRSCENIVNMWQRERS